MIDWTVFWIEAAVITMLFTGAILIPLCKNPLWWIHDYPEDIQEEYFKTHKRVPVSVKSKTVFLKKGFALLLALAVLVLLSKLAGADGFLSGFAISYGLWSVINWYDCFILDWVFFANIKKIRLPGTEHMNKAYHQKWYHFKRALIGAALGLVPSLIVGALCLV